MALIDTYAPLNGTVTGNGTVVRNAICINDTANSITVYKDGEVYAAQTEVVDGKTYIYVPAGEIKVDMDGGAYYAKYSGTGECTSESILKGVTDFINMPTEIKANEPFTLSAGMVDEWFNTTVTYEISVDGGTGAVLDGDVLTAYGAGTILVTDTAKDTYGYTFSKTYEIVVAFTPVSDIDAIPSATVGVNHNLSKYAVTNKDATYQTIEWTMVNANETDEISVANVILSNVSISSSNVPIDIEAGATLNLTLLGENTLTSNTSKNAALHMPTGAKLVITDESTGSLNATSGAEAAGISGHYRETSGDVEIHGGTITAMQPYSSKLSGAGIGGGYAGSNGSVTITGGYVNASTTKGGAGIGAGYGWGFNGGKVTITGGTVIASGKGIRHNGAGIGGGENNGNGGTVVITGGNVQAIAGDGAEAIGKGNGVGSSGTLKDSAGNDISLIEITLDGVSDKTSVTNIIIDGSTYGIKDVVTIGDKLYLYLPAGTKPASVTADGKTYECYSTNAGSYTATITGKGNCEGTIADADWSISKATPIAEMFTYTAPTNLVFDEQVKEATVTTDKVGMGEITIKYSESPVNVGTYTVSIDVEASINYNAVSDLVVGEFTIEKADSVITAAPTPIKVVYDGTAQNLINAGTATGGEMQYSLDGTNYSPTIPTGTDAEEYTVWYKVDGDENHNDTATERIAVTIAPKTLEISSVTASDRVFDGTNAVEISEVIISGILDADNVSASATATINSMNAGDYTTVDLSNITLTGSDASNYSIAASAEDVPLTTPVTISKADAPTLPSGSKAYVYSIGYEGESFSITGLPTDCGEVTYSLLGVSSDMFENVSVDLRNGKITYNVKALDSYTEDLQGTISVNVKMDNYEDAFYALDVTRRDKYAVTVKDGMSVALETNEFIYGQRLYELAFKQVTFVGEAGEVVDGTLKWEDPEEVPDVATDIASWRFIPESDAYKAVVGTLDITVKQAPLEVEAVPVVTDRTYDPSVTLESVVLSGGTVKDAYGNTIEGSWSWVNPGTVPTVGNAGYEAVFTPAAPNMPESSLSVPYTTDTVGETDLPTGWTWQNGETALEVGVVCNAVAVYTGADAGNYETESVMVAITRAVCVHGETEVRGAVSATCTEDGYTGDTYCKVCDTKLAEGSESLAEGHDYASRVTKEPTVNEEGERTYTCGACGDSYTEPIAKLEPEPTPAPTPTTAPTEAPTVAPVATSAPREPGKPFMQDDTGKSGWEVIRNETAKAKEGDTIVVDMNGTTQVPGKVFDDIKGKDITISLDMGDNISWTINGKEITADKVNDINFEVKVGTKEKPVNTIPVEVINKITGERSYVNISLVHDGELGLKAILNINLDAQNAGLFANLFYYNEQYGVMQFVWADDIDQYGTAHLVFTHASEYSIVIDKKILNANVTAPKTGDIGDSLLVSLVMLALVCLGTGSYLTLKRRKRA